MIHTLRNWLFSACILGAVSAWAQPQPNNGPKKMLFVDGVVAVVGEKIILSSDFETEKVQYTRGRTLTDSSKVYCQLLEDMIVRKLMISQAELDSLPLSEDRVEQEIDNRIRSFQRQAGSMADLEKYLGKSVAEFKEEIRPKMREQMLSGEMRNKITGTIRISPKEVIQYYEKIPQDSLPVIPTEVEVAQMILEIPVADFSKEFTKSQLEELRTRIINGESFERLARTYSMDPGSKNNNGILPEFGRGEMVGQFERMAFKLKQDSISPVFQTEYGYHIMKLIKRKGERVVAAHILIRPDYTSEDYAKAKTLADSIQKGLTEGKIDWCAAVKSHASEKMGNLGYCGFITDEATGLQKTLFEALSSDVKQIVEKMKPGEYSTPQIIMTPDGRSVYRIVYLKSFVAPHQANLIQDYSRIQMEAESEKKQKAVEKWVAKYRGKTYIKVYGRDFNCDNLKKWTNE